MNAFPLLLRSTHYRSNISKGQSDSQYLSFTRTSLRICSPKRFAASLISGPRAALIAFDRVSTFSFLKGILYWRSAHISVILGWVENIKLTVQVPLLLSLPSLPVSDLIQLPILLSDCASLSHSPGMVGHRRKGRRWLECRS